MQSPSHPSPARRQRAGAGGCYKGAQRRPSERAPAAVWKPQGRILPVPCAAGEAGAGAAPQGRRRLGGFPRAVSYERARRAGATGLAGGRPRPRPPPRRIRWRPGRARRPSSGRATAGPGAEGSAGPRPAPPEAPPPARPFARRCQASGASAEARASRTPPRSARASAATPPPARRGRAEGREEEEEEAEGSGRRPAPGPPPVPAAWGAGLRRSGATEGPAAGLGFLLSGRRWGPGGPRPRASHPGPQLSLKAAG